MILFGGRGGGPLDDLWALDFSGTVGVAPGAAIAPRLAIERARARGGAILLDLTLANAEPLRIDVVDVAGRRGAEQNVQARPRPRPPAEAGPGGYFVAGPQ